MKIITLLIETAKGKSILRSLFDQKLKDEVFDGDILDLGSGKKASYLKFDNFNKNKVITINMYTGIEPDLLYNLEYPFPIKDNSMDNVLAFNFLEHIYNFMNVFSESYRVLKPGGKLYFEVPFLYHVHHQEEPLIGDYLRYTRPMLEKILRNIGFSKITIVPFGDGPFIAGFSHIQFLMPRFFVPLPLAVCVILDKIILRVSRGYYSRYPFPLGYYVMGEK